MGFDSCLILEDIEDSAKWLKQCISAVFPEIKTVCVSNCGSAHSVLMDTSFDIALIDLSLPDGNGVDIIKQIKQKNSDTVVVVVTIHDDDNHIFAALKSGASGYLLKDTSSELFVDRLKGIISGIPPLSPAIAIKLIDYFSVPATDEVSLTTRESAVLQHIAKGMNSKQVAKILGITHNTVSGYVKTVYRKLGISSRAEASIEAYKRGLL